MRSWYISEMDSCAPALAMQAGMGVEIIDFCVPQNLENRALILEKRRALQGVPLSLHAPYCEIFPCAIDPLVRNVAMHRLMQAAEICAEMDIGRMVVHSGYAPQMYYPEWFVPRSVEFWKEFLLQAPAGVEIALENVLDPQPDFIAQVCDQVGDARLKLCLDVGHVNVYSNIPLKNWIGALGNRIAHVHLHNNDGSRDAHNALDHGTLNIGELFSLLDRHAPSASICIESVDASACLKFLKDEEIEHVRSL